ncbi:unnamed protein product [Kuraishia capsulata CBS 1993]|uniref:Uncharacterized protein n=1 Tax=Kuraishia capsulata CBS 1993 TaxID=1382522 RepID=W6MJQ0_9ASCO|nr:uncharacterized protein KUCA_T00000688001 [Kuraishia capsulata CBS 1993]CDK24722.1 unnamed protein product [Kuraishia capsulata CBS 1993]
MTGDTTKMVLDYKNKFILLITNTVPFHIVIKHGEIVKSPAFSLLEGTNALEVLNSKLDTGIIELTASEANFDVTLPRDVDSVCSIFNEILKSLATWLDNSSLSITLLSCRYVEELQVNCTKYGISDINQLGFFPPKEQAQISPDESDEYLLVHKVLRAYTIGISKFVNFVLTLGQAGVIYNDEDLNVQTMDLDYCNKIEMIDVIDLVDEASEWLGTHEAEGYAVLIQFMHLLSTLLSIPSVLSRRLELYLPENSRLDLSFLELGEQIALDLQKNADFFEALPKVEGCFSVGAQKRLSNRSPPKPLTMDSHALAYSELARLFKDTKRAMSVVNVQNIGQLQMFNLFFMNQRATQADEDDQPTNHVVARAVLQLFFIRDDKTIMGGSKTLTDLLIDDMKFLCCCGAPSLKYLASVNPDLSLEDQSKLPVISSMVLELIGQLQGPYFMQFTTISQNSARQRQHFCKSILAWDTLHVMAEKLEIDLHEEYQIYDCFKSEDGTNQEAMLPISSWVYFYKLKAMLEIVLRGIELGVYKAWELQAAYWYAAYLNDFLDAHISRLQKINKSRMDTILSIPKRLKKLKAGEKKQKLKAAYQDKMEAEFPLLQQTFERLKYLQFESNISRLMMERQRAALSIFHALDLLKFPKQARASEAMLFALQMKPFASVGVPAPPNYGDFNAERSEITTTLKNELKSNATLIAITRYFQHIQDIGEKAGSLIQYVVKGIESGDMDGDSFALCKSESIQWYRDLEASNNTQTIVMKVLQRKLQDKAFVKQCLAGEKRIEITRKGYHRHYPICKIA